MIDHIAREGEKIGGVSRAICRKKRIVKKAKKGRYEAIVVRTVHYGCETWVINARTASHVEFTFVHQKDMLKSFTNELPPSPSSACSSAKATTPDIPSDADVSPDEMYLKKKRSQRPLFWEWKNEFCFVC